MTLLHWIPCVVLELAALLTLGLDWYQTVRIQRAGHVEVNPIMGRHPSDGVIAAYFLACLAVELGAWAALLALWDPFIAAIWSAGWSHIEAYTVGWNRALGNGP